jgi:hypothetical protein
MDVLCITIDKIVALTSYPGSQSHLARPDARRGCHLEMINSIGHLINGRYLKGRRGQPLPTNSVSFRAFKTGLWRTMYPPTAAYSKLPFEHRWFGLVVNQFPPNNVPALQFLFQITLAWACFLRVGELHALETRDLTWDPIANVLTVLIRQSKTDQRGIGERCYVVANGLESNPITWIHALATMRNDVCPSSIQAMRSHPRIVMTSLKIPNLENTLSTASGAVENTPRV